MQWQDYVIAVGSILFIIALMPSVLGKNKPALSTSVMTGSVLMVFAITYTTLHLWFAGITTALTAIQWFILAIQKYQQKPEK
ncbi:MAG TPA: hypothetical protein VG992_03380 [Candidatus Saccharimonadales bacterium]|nr:hypothetical protein [Candidatus Saccharimonadales bacterium]